MNRSKYLFLVSLIHIVINVHIVGVSTAHAELMQSGKWGPWDGGSYSNDQTKKFSHCAAGVTYNSGIYLVVAIQRDFSWTLGFANQAWNLAVGDKIPLNLSFDGKDNWDETAFVSNKSLVYVPMASNSGLINSFRASNQMSVTANGSHFAFNLNGTSRLLPELASCVQTALAIERGDPPPTIPSGASSPVAANSNTSAPRPDSPQPAQSAAMEIAATRIASNLLLESKLPHARLLSKAETPDNLKQVGAVWTSDAGMGAVSVFPSGSVKDAQQIASNIISGDSINCKGDFASGRSNEIVDNVVIVRAFTGCNDSSGGRSVRYFILHKENSDYVIYGLLAGGVSSDASPQSPLRNSEFVGTAVKAAFVQ